MVEVISKIMGIGRATEPYVEIAGHIVGPGNSVFIIAEAGCNHNGDIGMAKELIDVAAAAGADVVKFQAFRADNLATRYAPKAAYALEVTDQDESAFDMLRNLELSLEHHQELADHCKATGILYLSSVFDLESTDSLDSFDMPAYKIPSGEISNHPLVAHIALKGKPIILSTGMSYLGEVEEAVRVIQEAGNSQIALLHCTSNYPTEPRDVNLRAITTMAQAFGVPLGYSDHTRGVEISVAAVAMGASIIEKHFTLDRELPGPDHGASLEPHELQEMVRCIRNVEAALGDGLKRPVISELDTLRAARKSIVAQNKISKGAILTSGMLTAKRPGTGISPVELERVIGRTTKQDISADEMIAWEMLH